MSENKCFCHFTAPDGSVYEIKDKVAREEIETLKSASGGGGKLYRHLITFYRGFYEHVIPERENGNDSNETYFTLNYIIYSSSDTPLTLADMAVYASMSLLSTPVYFCYDAPEAQVTALLNWIREDTINFRYFDPTNPYYPTDKTFNAGEYVFSDTVTEV